MPATFNYEAWIQWLVAQSNDWNNFAIVEGAYQMNTFRKATAPSIEVVLRWNHEKGSWFKLPGALKLKEINQIGGVCVCYASPCQLKEAFAFFDVGDKWDIIQEPVAASEVQSQTEEDPISKQARLIKRARTLTAKLTDVLGELAALSTPTITIEDQEPDVMGSQPKRRARAT
eukprot:3969632-Amphidinium_carterae.1